MFMINSLASKNKTLLFILAILLQIVVLTVMVLNSYLIILWGEHIVLQVEPVDPHSLFQGDYVRLGYGLNSLDLSQIAHDFDPAQIKPQDRIYLSLLQKGDTWAPGLLTLDVAKVRDQTYLRGKVLYVMGNFEKQLADPPRLQAEWGIEQYFIPEGTGRAIEEQITTGTVYAEIAVHKGKARVTGLLFK